MSSKRPRPADSQPPLGADDFKLINRIGPSIAQRLYDAGILTFERLASLSADEIIEQIGNHGGLSATRIREEDWIGQAHELAASKSSQKALVVEAATAEASEVSIAEQPFEGVQELRQRYATFTFELLLGPDGEVRRTRVAHIQSAQQTAPRPKWDSTWPGWDPNKVVRFIIQQANLPQAGIAGAGTGVTPSVSTPTNTTPPENEHLLKLREMKIVPTNEDKPRSFLAQGRPFNLELRLELKHDLVSSSQPLSYSATIYAKKLGGDKAQKVGMTRGSFTGAEPVLRVAGIQLPVGLYRLNADVTVTLPSADPTASSEIAETLRGDLLQIY